MSVRAQQRVVRRGAIAAALAALLSISVLVAPAVSASPLSAQETGSSTARTLVEAVAPGAPFSDVPATHKFAADISWLKAEGITTGNADGTFGPKSAVSREAMAAFLYRYAGSPKTTVPAKGPFTDVPKSHKFAKEITWLKSEGITTGNADGSFGPKSPVSREAMAAFLYRFADSPKFAKPTKAPFTDVPANAKFAKQIAWLSSTKITTGNADGSFKPKSAVSREAMAAFLHRYDAKFGEVDPEPEQPPVRADSVAFAERNWTPTEYDTCPASLHRQFSTIGPDGKRYPTWHPAQVVDPATGQTCTFGHEHGADPETSDIYEWVADFYAPDDLVEGEPMGLPFGYTSEELNDHVHEHGGAMRHEDNGGHKVFLVNNVKMLAEDRSWLRLPDGSNVVCDFLIKQHQGSWSPDATSNNAHEVFFAAKCNDGTEVISTLLTRFGNANEMHGTCAPNGAPIPTVGSSLPAGDGGKRIIPTRDCVQGNPTDWTLYEVWQADNRIKTADGSVLASFDPWFGVRNPSRMYDASASTETTNGISRPLDLAWLESGAATDYLWAGLAGQERFDYRDPRSPFDGAQRDFYLGQLRLASPGTESGIVYTDPYGGAAQADRVKGSVPQLIKPGSVLGEIGLAQQKFDSRADFGKDNGVHAPN